MGTCGAAFLAARRLCSDDDEEHDDGESFVIGARPPGAFQCPSFPSGAPRLSFLSLGDVGLEGPKKESVCASMRRTRGALPFSFVCLLGDNFYRDGVTSVGDPQWEAGFERAFAGRELDVPFYAALGNHDHSGNAQAQVEYGQRGGRWRMPAQYYSFVQPVGGGMEAEFFVLDTEAIRRRDSASSEQLVWFEEKLASSRARWKIVIGHHPVRSNGVHGGIGRVRDALEPLFLRHGVALHLSGHDHDLELLQSGHGFLQVVSGAGSSTRSMRWGEETLFASARPGFVWIGIDADVAQIVFVDAERGPVFGHRSSLEQLIGGTSALEQPALLGGPG